MTNHTHQAMINAQTAIYNLAAASSHLARGDTHAAATFYEQIRRVVDDLGMNLHHANRAKWEA